MEALTLPAAILIAGLVSWSQELTYADRAALGVVGGLGALILPSGFQVFGLVIAVLNFLYLLIHPNLKIIKGVSR